MVVAAAGAVFGWCGDLVRHPDRGGVSWNGMDATLQFRETFLFGIPLMVATVGAILL
jgi:hypothetical protein